MIGEKFGLLTVVERRGVSRWREAIWLCRCGCGREVEMRGKVLRRGARSCGCEATRKLVARSTRHGAHGSPEHVAWRRMLDRCGNPKRADYAYYGGRGISVCEAWQASFEAFLADMGPRPSPAHSIDRQDNELGYEPGNCRWATQTEQQNNRRSNVQITFEGKTQTVAQWEREMGLRKGSVGRRLKWGWSVDRALRTPTGCTQRADISGAICAQNGEIDA